MGDGFKTFKVCRINTALGISSEKCSSFQSQPAHHRMTALKACLAQLRECPLVADLSGTDAYAAVPGFPVCVSGCPPALGGADTQIRGLGSGAETGQFAGPTWRLSIPSVSGSPVPLQCAHHPPHVVFCCCLLSTSSLLSPPMSASQKSILTK